MKRIVFTMEKQPGTDLIQYPDDIELFANADTSAVPGSIVADYKGALDLPLYVDPGPAPQTILSHHEFRARFTFAEKVAIQASTDPGVQVVQADLNAANEIDLENAELKAGMEYLVAVIPEITEARKTEILAI